jgi:hypothetical protein
MRFSRLLPLVLCIALAPGAAHALDATEYQVKAAYLYNFTRFIEWPGTDGAFRVCVLGSDPFGEALAPLAQRTRDGRAIVLSYPSSAREGRACNLLYIAPSEAAREAAILAALAGAPVLTISSLPGFVERGGGIGFVLDGSHVRFAINRAACKRHSLTCSAKLLEAAVRVVDDADKEEGR